MFRASKSAEVRTLKKGRDTQTETHSKALLDKFLLKGYDLSDRESVDASPRWPKNKHRFLYAHESGHFRHTQISQTYVQGPTSARPRHAKIC